jgi:hypothetical protein
MERRFRSKVDPWLIVPAIIGVSSPLVMLVVRLASGRSLGPDLVLFPAVSVVLASLLFVSYSVTDDSIVVRRGLWRSRMPLDRLRELKATQEGLSSPALSLDRIEIRTDRGLWLMVSPLDKQGFVKALQARVPSIKLVGVSSGDEAK